MFGVFSPQASFAAVLIGVILAVGVAGFRHVSRFRRQDPRAHSHGVATIEGEDDLTLDANAARLLDVEQDVVTSVTHLCEVAEPEANASKDNLPFRAALTSLVHTGAGFEVMIRNKAGALISAKGATAGRRAVVRLQPATREEIALSDALTAKRIAEDHAALMTMAAEGRNGVAFCVDASCKVLWRSEAFASLPASGRDALLAEARAHGGAVDEAAIRETDPRLAIEMPAEKVLHLSLAPQNLPDGRRLWLARDISREVEAESAFRRFVHTMSDTFAHLKMSLMIFDRDRRLTLFNPATVDIVRIDASWLAQRPTLKALLDRMRDVRITPEQANYLEWRDRILAGVASTSAGGALDGGGENPLEDLWHLANGRTLHVLARPHPSGGLAVVIDDVSATIALRRQSVSDRAVHMATTDVLEEAVILFAQDGVARLSNASFRALWRLDVDAVAGQHVSAIIGECRAHAPDASFWSDLSDCVTGQRRRSGVSAKLSLRDGRVMMARISPVPDGGVLAVFSDITDSERIAAALIERNEVLEKTQEMRTALIDQISHQIRTPLNSISGFGQLLRDQHFGALNTQQKEYVDGIAAASQELLNAINGMTEIIDLDDNHAGSPATGAAILEEVVKIVNQRKGREAVRITPMGAMAPPTVIIAAQRGHLRQIMFNLITDALSGPVAQATDAPATAEVAIGVEDDTLHIVCARREDTSRAGPTLAFAMASRLARILGGAVTLDVSDGLRTLCCQTPVAALAGAGATPQPLGAASATTAQVIS